MTSVAGTLAGSFLGSYRGTGVPAREALEAALADLARRGRAAWPDVPLDEHALASYLGVRAPEGEDVVGWLAAASASDLFLACACAAGISRALSAFDAQFLGKMDLYLRALRPTPELCAETRQRLREQLFVSASGEPSKIHRYEGRGSLEGWVRVAAVRTALKWIRAEKAAAPRPDQVDELAHAMLPGEGLPGEGPELALARARYSDELVAALREAIAALPKRDRALLRSAFLERLTPARIGAMYGVHRTTVMRRLEAVQEDVLRRTQARMMDRLHLSPSDCEEVIGWMRSAIDVSLSSLLRTPG